MSAFFPSCQRYWKIQSSQVVRPFHTPASVEYGQSIISIYRCCFLFIDAVFIAQYYIHWTRNVLILTKFSECQNDNFQCSQWWKFHQYIFVLIFITQYCIQKCNEKVRTWIKCQIYKRHPTSCLEGWVMGELLWVFGGENSLWNTSTLR